MKKYVCKKENCGGSIISNFMRHTTNLTSGVFITYLICCPRPTSTMRLIPRKSELSLSVRVELHTAVFRACGSLVFFYQQFVMKRFLGTNITVSLVRTERIMRG